MALEMPEQSLYSMSQLNQYLDRIDFPINKHPRIEPLSAQNDGGLSFLEILMKYQLSSVPFENLSLHYSPRPNVSLDPNVIFNKIVKNHRGGYCMELNLLFGKILKCMGYEVVSTGARVAPPGMDGTEDPRSDEGLGWNHQVNLVRIKDTLYSVDVGFGGLGPTKPLPLIENTISPWGATAAEMRLTYHISENSFVQGVWSYEHRVSKSTNWTPVYHFGLTRFTEKDFNIMNLAVSTQRTSLFTKSVICTKILFHEGSTDIIGMLILSDGTLKKRVHGISEVILKCANETERVELLKDHFGIVLSTKEQNGIKGTITDLG